MELKLLLFHLIVPLILLDISVNCSKLNVPRVLLPIFNDFATNFTLEATEGGCYKWSTTRSDIIHITPIDEDHELKCSTKAVISTVTKEAARNMAVVLADDPNTKQMLRCDVMVDTIHELRITTTTRELFMEEAPEDFEVHAYDDQGNEFSTLEGVPFDWNIVSLGANRETVLRYIAYRDSPYETPKAIENLENQQEKGYLILLEGVKSGSAKVSVRLPFNEYKHVPPCEVQLMVVANLLITPAEVYLMQGDTATFTIYFIKDGRMEEIILPNSQYYIEAENSAIVYTNKQSGEVEALNKGNTRVVLRDRNIDKSDPLMKLPAANVHIVEPEYIVLNMMPHKNWAILVADHHDISAELYTQDDHKVLLGSNARIDIDIGPEFAVVTRTPNGSWVSGYGIKPSVCSVQAYLQGINSERSGKIMFSKSITAKNDILIYPRITVVPSEVILPWDPVTRPKFEIPLKAKGGDGKYLWVSTDNSVGMVSQNGVVRTQSNGFFEVAVLMLRNHHNRASAKFIILPPTRLEIVEFVMEAEVGAPVYLHIALYAEQEKDGKIINLPFTQCQNVPFHIKMSDQKFRQNKTVAMPPVGVSCGNIAMTALEVGTSKVTVSYFQDGKALEDSVTLSAFKTLQLIEPRRDIVLAVGTTLNLVYVGGPRPQLGRSAEFSRTVVSEDANIVQAKDVTSFFQVPREDTTVVQVLCAKLGETDIKLMISNTPTVTSCKTQTHAVRTRVICGKPRKIVLQPELKIADTDACPMDLGSGNVVVQSTRSIDIEVSVFDDSGLKFLNVTSLLFDWVITPYKSATVQSLDSVFPRNLTIGNIPVGHSHYQSLDPGIERGSVILNVTIKGYRSSVLKYTYTKAEYPPFVSVEDGGIMPAPIKFSLALYLVEDAVISPNLITIFNHPGNKQIIPVKQGSGFFELAVSSDDVAIIKYVETTRELHITPLKSGEVTVQLIDLCLVARPATLVLQIVAVGIIRVEMVDKVEIAKCIPVIVRLYDESDNLMDVPDPDMIDLRPEFEDSIANIYLAENNPSDPWLPGEIHFVITGLEVGDTKLVFSVSGSDEEIHSAPLDLQVFEPLKLSPRNASMIVNSKLQISSKGGPRPDVKIVFFCDSKYVNITEKGVIQAKALGHAIIVGKAIGVHPYSGKSVIYAEDHVEIQVVKLLGIKVVSPCLRFKVGVSIPFWVWGLPNISPMILGGFDDPPIQFKWNVDDKLLVDLSGIFHPVGVFKKKLDRVAAKVLGLQIGKTRLFVNATVPGKTVNIMNLEFVTLNSWVDIEVIPEFLLNSPKNFPGKSLLMAPFSSLQLKTNLDGKENVRINYVLPGDQSFSTDVLLADKSTRDNVIVTVSPTGLIQAYGVLGQTMLIVTSTDDLGLKQRLMFVIEVKQIQFMNLNVFAKWRIHSDTQLRTVPLGTEFKLKATFHDNVGNIFHAGPKQLKIRTSRCDLLKVGPSDEDATVIIYTKAEGSTTIKGWAEGIQQTADYMKVHTEQSVRPILDSLTSGDVICLWTPVVSDYNVPGVWKSSDDALIHINPALDIGFVGNKEGVVVLTHSFLQSAPIQIEINVVSQIEFIDYGHLVLTNGLVNTVTRVVLVLQSDKSFGVKTNNLIQGWRCRADVRKIIRPHGFKCFGKLSNESSTVTFDQLFNITPSWVPDTGQYACKLINLGKNGTAISTLTTDVLVWATTTNEEVASKTITLRFLPGVFTVNKIDLEDTFNGEFLVIGLPEVLEQIEVAPADSSILYVDSGTETGPNGMKYQIQLIDYHWRLANLEEAMGIIVTSRITQQNIKIIVTVSGSTERALCGQGGRSPIMVFFYTYKYALLSAATMLIIFCITFYFYSRYMQPVVNVNLHSPRPPPGPPGVGYSRNSPYNSTHSCSANNYLSQTRLNGRSPRNSPEKYGCTCCSSMNTSREPIYGEASTFYNSPDVRSNRRMM